MLSPAVLGEGPFLALSSFQWPLAFLGSCPSTPHFRCQLFSIFSVTSFCLCHKAFCLKFLLASLL